MASPVILLVDPDTREARRIAEAFGLFALPQPAHVSSGEHAVDWVRNNRCDACVVAYKLPGIDGLETLARLHQRQPDLPVVVLSAAQSEQVAVAAFRAGVADYIPKRPGFPEVVAQRIRQIVEALPAASITLPHVTRDDVPESLLRPNYQNRLRVIGRQLDLHGYHSVNLLEVGGGFLVRALVPGNRTPEALEFPDRDFALLMSGAIEARGERNRVRSASPLLPTGYEDFLRALGDWLDEQAAEAITLTDLDTFVAVGGVVKAEGRGHTTMEPMRRLLYPDDINQLLDAAFRQRTATGLRGSIARMLGRSVL